MLEMLISVVLIEIHITETLVCLREHYPCESEAWLIFFDACHTC